MRLTQSLYLTVALFAGCSFGSVFAADGHGRFVVKGAGMTSCAQFVDAAAQRGAAFVSYAGWLEGFVSAVNRYEEQTYDLVSWQGTELLMASLANYCSRHPAVSFHDAAIRLANQLRATVLQEKSPLVAVPLADGDDSVVLYAVVIERVQHRLSATGLYSGEAHGRFDAPTRTAIREFQVSRQLPPTGEPDQATLAHLLQ